MTTVIESGTRRWPSQQARQDNSASARLLHTQSSALRQRARSPLTHRDSPHSINPGDRILLDNGGGVECDLSRSKQRTGVTSTRQCHEALDKRAEIMSQDTFSPTRRAVSVQP